jgi:chaperonin GroEL
MQEKKDGKILLGETEAREAIMDGAKDIYDAVVTTYGPRGRNVMIEKTYGFPLITRDGVTVAKETYFTQRRKNMGAKALYESSETTNRVAGDGTSATVALGYHLLAEGTKSIAAGFHPMELKDQITRDSQLLLDKLATLSKPLAPGQAKQVATVSSGDPVLGELIADAIEYVGPDGGVITERSMVGSVECDYVNGYYLQPGFEALQAGKKEINNPVVVVLQKRVSSLADVMTLLNKVAEAAIQPGEILPLVLIGNIEGQAYNTVVDLTNKGQLDAIIVKTPGNYGEMGRRLLEDIAVYADCEPVSESANLREFAPKYLGRRVERVVATKTDATLFADGASEALERRVQSIKDQIAAETVDGILERLKDRVAKLEGKIAIFRIGGASDTAKEEKEFRVEDAILATRAAVSHGVVPGGGTTLLELSKVGGLSRITRTALRNVFCQLLINANRPEQVGLQAALDAKPGYGFNLRGGDELVDLVKAGILDPTLVVENVVRNSCEMAANLLSLGMLIVHEEKDA